MFGDHLSRPPRASRDLARSIAGVRSIGTRARSFGFNSFTRWVENSDCQCVVVVSRVASLDAANLVFPTDQMLLRAVLRLPITAVGAGGTRPPAASQEDKLDPTIVESIATGVVSNYVFSIIAANSPERLKKLAPALFFGGPTPLNEAERAFKDARAKLLKKYSNDAGVQRFLSDKKLREGSLAPLFNQIFLSKPIVSKELDGNFYQCFDNPTLARSGGYHIVIDDIINEIRRALLSRSATAPYVIESSLREIQRSIAAIERMTDAYSTELKSYSTVFEQGNAIDAYSKYYLSEIKEYLKSIFINGLEMISKKERIIHLIGDAYVPILVHHVQRSGAEPERSDAFEVMRETRRLIVRGPAGCGKTTLMQWLIWNAEPFANEKVTVDQHQMFPIYIPLRRLESAGTIEFTVDSVLYNAMPNDILKRDFPRNWLDTLIERGIDVIVLIDGVDEIAEVNRSHIWRVVRNLSERYPSLRMLITSRHISTVHLADGSYRPEIFLSEEAYQEARSLWNRPDDFFEFIVSPLSNSDIVDLIDKWFNGVDPNLLPRSERDKLATYPDQLKKALFERENAVPLQLARTPLLCSLICLVFFLQLGRLPRNRKQLYELSTLLLVETRDEHKGVRPDPKFYNFNLEKRLRLLKAIALIMQEGSETVQADQSIEVERARVLSWMERLLTGQTTLKLPADEYIDFLVERCSLIREPSAHHIDFVHRSFMEYLAAEEIVASKQPFQIREKITLDEWWNTLIFCMTTTAGGAFYGSMLLHEILEYLLTSTLKNKRKFIVKALSLLQYVEGLAQLANETVKSAASQILPPRTETESLDLSAIPVSILEELIPYQKVQVYPSELVEHCVSLLCFHEDEEVRRIFLSGYVGLDDRNVINKINQTGKVSVTEHTALFKRIQNRSFTDPVYLTTDDLRDKNLRSAILQSVWIKLPVIGDNFVGWDTVNRCREVRLLSMGQGDLDIMDKSVHIWGFENCKELTILFGHGFNFRHMARLFPKVETIAIQRSSGVHLDGMGKLENLRELWFENCTQAIHIEEDNIPRSLKDLIFFRSVNPVVKSKPEWLKIHTETLSKDNILLQ
jgi:NACHT domain